MRDDAKFRLAKNPYHLFAAYMKKRRSRDQKGSAALIAENLGTRAKAFSERTMVEMLRSDYIDATSDIFLEQHLPAMNAAVKLETGLDVDFGDPESRKAMEKDIGYHYPGPEDRKANSGYNVFRGGWQLLHPSLQPEHNLSSGITTVRAAAILFFGFLTERAGSPPRQEGIRLLIVGESTVWMGTAWMGGPEKLFIRAWEIAREDNVEENQFLVFHVPGYHVHFTRKSISEIAGVLSGTVLGAGFKSDFPAVACPCVARKMKAWTSSFLLNDQEISSLMVRDLRRDFRCGYPSIADLSGRRVTGDEFEAEYYRGIDAALDRILVTGGNAITMVR